MGDPDDDSKPSMYRRRRRDGPDEDRRMTDNGKNWVILNRVEKDIMEMFWQPARWIREEFLGLCPGKARIMVTQIVTEFKNARIDQHSS